RQKNLRSGCPRNIGCRCRARTLRIAFSHLLEEFGAKLGAQRFSQFLGEDFYFGTRNQDRLSFRGNNSCGNVSWLAHAATQTHFSGITFLAALASFALLAANTFAAITAIAFITLGTWNTLRALNSL